MSVAATVQVYTTHVQVKWACFYAPLPKWILFSVDRVEIHFSFLHHMTNCHSWYVTMAYIRVLSLGPQSCCALWGKHVLSFSNIFIIILWLSHFCSISVMYTQSVRSILMLAIPYFCLCHFMNNFVVSLNSFEKKTCGSESMMKRCIPM